MRLNHCDGQSLMEALLAIAVFTLGMATLGVLVMDASVSERKSTERTQALVLAQEGIEAVRSLRDTAFGNLASGTHGLALSGSGWFFSGTSDTRDGFTRTVQIGEGGPELRFVTSTVSWYFTPSASSTISLATVLTNWRRNAPSSWANPQIVATTTFIGSVAAYAVQVSDGRLYVSTQQNAAAPEFYIYDISNEAAPVLQGSLELGFSCFSLGIFGNRAYVASDNNPDEVKIVDVSSSTDPVILGSIKLTGNQNVNSLAVSGSDVHLVRDKQGNQATYYIYNASVPALPQLVGSLNLGEGGQDLALRGGVTPYTFFATQDEDQEFKTVNITTPPLMSVSGGVNLSGVDELLSVAVSGTLAFAGAESADDFAEFYSFNIADPAAPSGLGSLRLRGDVRRLEVVRNLAFLATSSSTGQFMVLDVTSPAAPTLVGKALLAGTATDVAMSPSGNYAYVTTDSPDAGLYIITLGY